jgi:hypothetical protein
MLCLLALTLSSVIRFFSMSNLASDVESYLELTILSGLYYNKYCMLNVLLDLKMFPELRHHTIEFVPREEYFEREMAFIKSEVVDKIGSLMETIERRDPVKASGLQKILQSRACDSMHYKEEFFPSCAESLGGIADGSIQSFIIKFHQLIDHLWVEFTRLEKYNDDGMILDMLGDSRVASILLYANIGFYGLHDSIYYALVIPATTLLEESLNKVPNILSTVKTLSIGFYTLISLILLTWQYYTMPRLLNTLYRSIYLLPLQMIYNTPQVMRVIQRAALSGIFTLE